MLSKPSLFIITTFFASAAQYCFAFQQEVGSNVWQVKPAPKSSQGYIAVEPTICVVEQQGQRCQQEVVVQLALPQQQALCIYQMPLGKKLWCHQQAQGQQFTITIDSDKSVTLMAKDLQTSKVIASAEISVNVFQPIQQRRKRRYGVGLI